MKVFYLPFTLILILSASPLFSQCPPAGFPEPGNTCAQAPILCPTLEGYCATINNNNVSAPFPCCQGFTLNNDEWFAFFAGSTTIEIQVIPSNCSAGGQQGLQAAIYSHCPPGTCSNYLMDAQCSCTTNPFTLLATNYVVGQVYYFVLDGCGGNVCDYTIHVLQGSTAGFAPGDPGPVTGPSPACAGTSSQYHVDPVNGATIYTWTVSPAGAGTVTGTSPNATVNWAAGFSGTATVCVKASNLCYSNPTESCFTVEVLPKPTATISGSGVICSNSGGSVNLTVNLTGDSPWEFIYKINNVAQPAVQTSSSPYTIIATTPGTYTLQSVVSTDANPACAGTVSGTATVTQVTLNPTSVNTAAVCGQSNGAVNLSVSGGNSPYTYIWSGGETTQDLNNVPPGPYTVTITDNNGCTAVFNTTVNDNITNPNLSAVVTNNTTCINGNGAINLSVTPNGNWVYAWSNSETTQDLTNLTPGDYTVTVTQGPTCSATATYTVTDVPNVPVINSTTVNTTCDLTNGSINISVSGSTTPYTYAWSNNSNTQNQTNLLAGDYTVTVTGNNGCSTSATISITNNNPVINQNAAITANTTCNGGNGAIDLSVTPSGTYTYNWSNNSTAQDQTGLPPGDYDVTVTGQGSCSATATFNVPDNPNLPNVTASTTQSTCDLPNGAINVTVSGGVSPYTYLWESGQVTQDLSNIPAGDYTVTVTGNNGCTRSLEITVNNNNPPINVTAVITPNTVCNGTQNGSINVSVSPAGTYTYDWSTGDHTQDLTQLSPGTYILTVSAGGSCTEVATFDVPGNPNQPSINFNVVNTSCDFSNGTISLSVTGGTTPYTYSWASGQSSQNLTNIPAGTYFVTVTSANGCTSETSIDVANINPDIDLTASTLPNTACSSNYNGSINLSVFPNGTYTYDWSNGFHSQDISNLEHGTYFVTVSAGGTCTAVASFDVDHDPNLPTLNFAVTNARCGLPNGAINLTVSNGTVPYTYAWSSGQSSQDLTNIPAGLYIVTVTAANGCTAEDGVDVPNDDIPVEIDATVKGKTSCVSNNGSINLQITPANATIAWSIGGSSKNLTGLAVGDYTVTVSAGGTCTASATYTIDDQTELPVITGEINPAVCGFNNGSVNLNVEFGLLPYTYDWAHIPGASNPRDLNNLAAGNYVVTVTTSVGCTEVFFAPIDNDVLQIEITGVASDDYSCPTNNGFIDIDVTPTAAYTYNWAHIAGTNNSQDVQNLAAGNYTVTVTFGSCTADASFVIADAAIPPTVSVAPVAATCGRSDGAVNVSVSGATPPYTFNWSNLSGANDPQNLSNVAPGTYSVTVTDFFDCTASATAIVQNTTIAINLAANATPNTSCAAPNGALDLSVTPTGTYIYTWSNAAATQDLNGIAPGIYSVTVNAGVGCTAEGAYIVNNATVNPKLDANIVAAICTQSNGSIDMTVTGGATPYIFAWSNMASTEDIANVFPGNYSFSVTDANGCKADTTLNVANNSNTFSLSGVVSPYNNCAAVNGAIDLTVTPPGTYTYLWSGGEVTQDLSGIPAGTYTVQVTESGSCIASATYFVTDDRTYPTLNQSITPELCNLSDAGIDLSVLGGLAPFTYKWSSGQTTEDLSAIGGGVYSVTVSGANNCSETTTITIPENDISFALSGTATANTSCVTLNGGVDLSVNPGVPSGGPGYSFKWSSGPVTEDLNAVAPGTYTVTVSAGGTCTNTAAFTVADDAGAPIISESITQALCGQNSGGINLTINGGQSPYSFTWNTADATEDLDNIVSGSYSVTVTGANGCKITGSFAVPEDVVIPNLSGITQPNTACVGPNGSVNLSISPSTLNYTINWSNGLHTQNLDNLTAGTYTVSVYGGGACTASATYTIGNNTTAVVTGGTQINVACFGDNSGAVNLTVTGGTQPFQYDWSDASIGNIEDPGSLAAGSYTVTVTDAVGCTSVKTFTITQPSAPVQINCTALNSVSQPGFTDGDAEIQIGGGTAPYAVLWSPGGIQNNVPAGNFPLNNLGVSNYDVTVTDSKGCTAICNFNIPLAVCTTEVGHMGSSQLTHCGTGCITAIYDQTGQVLDPNDILQFILHTGSDTVIVGEIARSSQPTFCFDPTKMQYEKTYYISAVAGNKDAGGNVNLAHFCTVVSAGTPIVFHEKPVASIAAPKPITCATLAVTLSGSSSLPGANYQWLSLNGHIVGSANQADITVDKKGKYTLYIDANNCADTTDVQVLDIRNAPLAKIVASPDDILDCVVDEIVLSGSVEGSINANAIWIDGNGTIFPGGATLKIDDPGTYQFVILDTLTFCSDTASVIIGENQLYPLLFINPPGTLTCTIGSLTLSGGSPIPNIQFQWATIVGQDTTIVGNGTSLNVTNPNTYYLIGVDPINGCTNAEHVTVDADKSYPTADAGLPFSIDCYGQTAVLNGTATGGTGVLTYSWSTNNGVIVSGGNTLKPTISEPGTYMLSVTSTGNGCTDTDPVVIEPNEPRAVATVHNPACTGFKGSVLIDTVLGARPPLQYSVTGGTYGVSGNLITNLSPGDYTIHIEDVNGCATSVQATIIEPAEFKITIEPEIAIDLGESIQLKATVNVPAADIAQISWTPATWLSCTDCLSPVADTPLYSTQYRIVVVTNEGCSDDANLLLRVKKELDVFIPNVFSPNGDGTNDAVTVYADARAVKNIKSFQIYSRWGERVFERYNFLPNDPKLGWDGKFNGQDVNPAVFVYYAVVEFIDGQEVLYKGDVTVER